MKLFKTLKNQKGFTLIELLVVIGILAVLLAITLIAINPARQFAQANDTKRRSDVNAVLNAINQFMADNKGQLPGDTAIPSGVYPTDAKELKKPVGTDGVDICALLVPQYLAALPVDPKQTGGAITDCDADYSTGYKVVKSASNSRLTVGAPAVEIPENEPITVTR